MAGSKQRRRPHLPDWHLWTEVAGSVDPLPRRRARALLQLGGGPLPLPEHPEPARHRAPRPALPSYQPDGRPGPQARPGEIEPRMRRRLGRGQIVIDATIDLHGMRQTEAHAALRRFLQARVARGDRTVLVITGKGVKRAADAAASSFERGVLRTMLPIWLREAGLAPLVAGWDVAARIHGGDGAFYVRLRADRRS